MLRIHGKGNKIRHVFIPKFLLKNWKNPYSSTYLFSNTQGKPLPRVLINQLLWKRTEIAGISKRITPHTFRRSLATNLYNRGGRLETIQKQLGHSSSDTTLGYIHNDFNTLYQDYSKIFQNQPNQAVSKPSLKGYTNAELLLELSQRMVNSQQTITSQWEVQQETERRNYV
ncbi:12249_t:CDS:1 [Entrophospora sp. SA101]|nr:13909_t:CDS:1 [Entrophospora sp. SA101]CAJ0637813.1 2575_t:CDS:1 [Entrophospora sp. SA101]CAJ0761783.1 12249_t:CDS:1 [Entrophospora sp. SA101]CAJ0847703.1 10770_t:CDS:1 [Entrophospora sp. SA101]